MLCILKSCLVAHYGISSFQQLDLKFFTYFCLPEASDVIILAVLCRPFEKRDQEECSALPVFKNKKLRISKALPPLL